MRQSSDYIGFHEELGDWLHQIFVDIVLVMGHVLWHDQFARPCALLMQLYRVGFRYQRVFLPVDYQSRACHLFYF